MKRTVKGSDIVPGMIIQAGSLLYVMRVEHDSEYQLCFLDYNDVWSGVGCICLEYDYDYELKYAPWDYNYLEHVAQMLSLISEAIQEKTEDIGSIIKISAKALTAFNDHNQGDKDKDSQPEESPKN